MITDETGEMKGAGSAMDTFKQYSGPAALFGLGLGWFLYDSYKQSPEEAPQVAPEPEEPERFAAIKQRAGEFKENAIEKSRQARERVSQVIEDRPYLVGIAGLTAGVLIGAITSGYLRDNQFLGETKETIRQKARGLLHDTKEKAEHVLDVARRAAREEAEKQRLITH